MTDNGDNTGHNDGYDTLHHQVRPEDGHGRDTDTGLGGPVGGTDASEGDGSAAALFIVGQAWDGKGVDKAWPK